MLAFKQLNLAQRGWKRRAEIAAMLLFVIAGLTSAVVLWIRSFSAANEFAPGLEQPGLAPQVVAQANAMPNQGWAPLQVYFSAFGSHTRDGAPLQRFEWDLDGNGSFDFDATSQGGYAQYSYSKPGSYTITLRVTDGRGRSAIDSVVIQVRHPASSSVDYWTVFDDSRLRRIELSLSQADWRLLWQNPEAKTMVRAEARVFGERLQEVGLRMRGQFSLREAGDKKPWEIDIDAFVDGQEYRNLRQLLLLNNTGDPSLMREKLAYEMMAFAGVPASHTAYVEVWFDLTDDSQPPMYWGVYTLVERIDRKYLANRFGPGAVDGNLYKASHAQRGPMDLVYYGPTIEDYPTQNGQVAYGKMNHEDLADYSDILHLCWVVDGAVYSEGEPGGMENQAEFIEALEAALNVDGFLRYLAVVTILDNWDTYPYTGNNYYLFNNSAAGGRFEWLPWDLTWGENAQAPLFRRSGPGIVQRAPLYDRVFNIPSYQRKYAAYLDLLARTWITPENVSRQAQRYAAMLRPAIHKAGGDKAYYGDSPMYPPAAFDESLRSLVRFTEQRQAFVQQELQRYLRGEP